ncbi:MULTISPECIES: CU044_5270 family protein [unclassified Streptosporangium]|uniref:CU044_5270 family protein n=1 Tax=unclassified Streptosporangium TaxID=2632669 RepID=UPI002E28C1F3|nr:MULTISPECIES: CU044_5270 family protein [unclassified Streptosporangium]
MNEFQFVDDVMPDVPASGPAKTAQVRARVLNGGRRRRISAWTGILITSAATVAVIGTVVVVPRLGGGPAATVTQTSAREVLDAAAGRLAQRQEVVDGRYWRGEMERIVWERISVGGHEFVVEDRTGDVRWNGLGRDKVMELTGLDTRPFTAADRAEWEKAGSPRLCGSDTDCENDMVPKGRTRYTGGYEEGFEQGTMTLSVRELQDLPRDPGRLKEKLLSYWPAEREAMKDVPAGSPGQAKAPDQDDWLWELSERLLLEAPITSGTRAAAYHMLAGLSGARIADEFRDGEGRTGVAILRGGANGEPEQQIVIDRETGDLLAVQYMTPVSTPGQGNTPDMSTVIRRLGWTDDEPVIPEGCVLGGREDCLR